MSEAEARTPGAPAGWYEVPGGHGRRCFWDGTRWAPWVGTPAWYEVPGEPGLRRYWGGTSWTDRYRRRSEPAALRWLLVLASLGLTGSAYLVGVTVLAIRGWGEPQPNWDDACSEGFFAQTGLAWAPWLVMLVLLAVGFAVTLRHGRTDYRMYLLLLPVAAAVTLTFPVWIYIGNGIGCAL